MSMSALARAASLAALSMRSSAVAPSMMPKSQFFALRGRESCQKATESSALPPLLPSVAAAYSRVNVSYMVLLKSDARDDWPIAPSCNRPKSATATLKPPCICDGFRYALTVG